MKKIANTIYLNKLSVFVFIGALMNMLPFLMGYSMKNDDGEYPHYVYQLESTESDSSLFTNLGAAVPVLLDIVLDYFYKQKSTEDSHAALTKNYVPNGMFLLVVTLPDAIFVAVIFPLQQYDLFLCLISARDSLLTCIFLLYLNKLAPKHFRYYSVIFIGFCFVIVNVLFTFSHFVQDPWFISNYYAMSCVILGIAFLELGRCYYKWCTYLQSVCKTTTPISKTDYICVVYSIFYAVFVIVEWERVFIPVATEYIMWTSLLGVHYFTIYTYIVFLGITCVRVFTYRLSKQDMVNTNQLFRARKEFMSYISHEIRTPLNIMKAGLRVLEEDLYRGVTFEQMKETLQDIENSLDIAVDTLSDMLTYDKVESKNMQLEKTIFNIATFITDSLRPFHLHAKAKNIQLILQVPPRPIDIDFAPFNDDIPIKTDNETKTESHQHQLQLQLQQQKSYSAKIKQLNILIVDDSDMNRKMLKRLLGTRFNITNMSQDGLDALNKIKEDVQPLVLVHYGCFYKKFNDASCNQILGFSLSSLSSIL
eukprot:gene1047-2050_t